MRVQAVDHKCFCTVAALSRFTPAGVRPLVVLGQQVHLSNLHVCVAWARLAIDGLYPLYYYYHQIHMLYQIHMLFTTARLGGLQAYEQQPDCFWYRYCFDQRCLRWEYAPPPSTTPGSPDAIGVASPHPPSPQSAAQLRAVLRRGGTASPSVAAAAAASQCVAQQTGLLGSRRQQQQVPPVPQGQQRQQPTMVDVFAGLGTVALAGQASGFKVGVLVQGRWVSTAHHAGMAIRVQALFVGISEPQGQVGYLPWRGRGRPRASRWVGYRKGAGQQCMHVVPFKKVCDWRSR